MVAVGDVDIESADAVGRVVVVADDDAVQRTYASAILGKLGYRPVEATNGLAALDLIRKTGAQFLICDLDMPGLNGHQLARQIREDAAEAYVHILMVTGSGQRNERERALEAGVDDFMAKPLDTASLKARVRSVSRLLRHEQLLAERNHTIAAAKKRIEDDIRAAASAQKRLLPPPYAEAGECHFHSAFVPSNILSGDIFAYYDLGNGLTGFYAADVAGHGVHASLLAVALGHLLTSDYFARLVMGAGDRPDPATLVSTLNERFFDENSHDYFTMFCGVLDRRTDILHYCQAGYPPAVMVDGDGGFGLIGDGGFPVGLMRGMTFENGAVPFPRGRSLVLMSDGAHEAENPDGEAFEETRIARAISAAAERPSQIPERLVTALSDWRGGAPLDDDLSVLVCERRSVG